MEKEKFVYVPLEYMKLKEQMKVSYFDLLFYCYLRKIYQTKNKEKVEKNERYINLTFTQRILSDVFDVDERQIRRSLKRLELNKMISYDAIKHKIWVFDVVSFNKKGDKKK